MVQGKYWSEHKQARHIEINGVCWLLDHLKDRTITIVIPAASGSPAVTMTVHVEFSSHCVSRGAKQGKTIDFAALGYEHLVIDHRQNRRAFHQGRHDLSFLLPEIVDNFADRRCFFTGHENFLTLELGKVIPGYADDIKYEIYFSVRKAEARNTLKLYIESAYVRDEDADNAPVNFKKDDKIKASTLLLKKLRGESIKAHRGRAGKKR